ncbi:MAG: cytochrome c3 family protein [Porticoccaceae bacterium]|nr:cytochrome c3 family protein [Pseudomonadales bacterium]MCP5171564.1 cytochrome c3 family protein [Pseudomonadales bacterium]
MKKTLWLLWLMITLSGAGYYAYQITLSDDKSEFLIGETSYGHYQIEMSCETCHTDPFGGTEVLQNACTNCHAEELERAHDSHPRKKFTDPREAFRLETIDARYCISCHKEHHQDRTHSMGVTLPDDYCFYCHQETVKERESHKGLTFDSCASAGCHNFHDNRALYENFLVSNAGQPWLLEIARISAPSAAATFARAHISDTEVNFMEQKARFVDETTHWQGSSHANAGVDCGGCHATGEQRDMWIDKPEVGQCKTCHIHEVEGFSAGKHGMRLSTAVMGYDGAISPSESPLLFKKESLDVQHGCNSCHSAHSFDTKTASVDSCVGCHNDEHTLSFLSSPHGQLWQKHIAGDLDNSEAVSCATCHMPRMSRKINGKEAIFVEHNQNDNFRPNEKMIRPVCMNCHGLGFTIDALADRELIKNNFSGKPGTHIESIEWSIERLKD